MGYIYHQSLGRPPQTYNHDAKENTYPCSIRHSQIINISNQHIVESHASEVSDQLALKSHLKLLRKTETQSSNLKMEAKDLQSKAIVNLHKTNH